MGLPRTVEQIRGKLNDLKQDLSEVEEQLDNFEPDISDDEYEQHLNETHEDLVVGCAVFQAGHVLRRLDPIAFQEAKLGYLDSKDPEDFQEYRELKDRAQDLEEDIEQEQADLDEAEAELEEDEEE